MIIQDDVPDASNWCFIIGFGRTGTTALVDALNGHSAIHMLKEAWMWGYVDLLQTPKYNMLLKSSPMYRSIEYYKAAMPDKLGVHLNNYELNGAPTDVTENIWQASDIRKFMEAFREISTNANALVFGEKNWYYRFILDDLLKVFPNCNLLITTRNKWDLAASSMDSAPFQERRSNLSRDELAKVALERAEMICAKDKEILKLYNNAYEVNFKKMANDPQAELRDLLQILHLDEKEYHWNVLDAL